MSAFVVDVKPRVVEGESPQRDVALEDELLVPDGGEGVLLGFRLARLFLHVGGGVDVRGEGPGRVLGAGGCCGPQRR